MGFGIWKPEKLVIKFVWPKGTQYMPPESHIDADHFQLKPHENFPLYDRSMYSTIDPTKL